MPTRTFRSMLSNCSFRWVRLNPPSPPANLSSILNPEIPKSKTHIYIEKKQSRIDLKRRFNLGKGPHTQAASNDQHLLLQFEGVWLIYFVAGIRLLPTAAGRAFGRSSARRCRATARASVFAGLPNTKEPNIPRPETESFQTTATQKPPALNVGFQSF